MLGVRTFLGAYKVNIDRFMSGSLPQIFVIALGWAFT